MQNQPPSLALLRTACQVCGAVIDDPERVHFSYGPPASRERLYARVCQLTNAPGCLNRGCHVEGISPNDCYGTGALNRDTYKQLQRNIKPKAA